MNSFASLIRTFALFGGTVYREKLFSPGGIFQSSDTTPEWEHYSTPSGHTQHPQIDYVGSLALSSLKASFHEGTK